MKTACALTALALLLAACGPKENDPGPGGVTVGEARALDDAAAMLDSRIEPIPQSEAPSEATPTSSASATAGTQQP